ncbi:MAG: glycosyltransferase family 2 protein [Bryobacteraceae bacterium]|jgi:dolichol-phosphate mannosyltransferase
MPSAEETYHLLRPRLGPIRLSLVIPMYNEEATVPFLRSAVTNFLRDLPCETEVVLVNDGSSDATLVKAAEWAADEARVKVIHFSRNFGHQLAATAGLDYATGDAVVLIDADLQDPLSVIHEMLERYRQGYDVVYGQREARQGETVFKRFSAWAFYRLMRTIVDGRLPVDAGDFRLLSRECLDGLQRMREQHRFLRGMVTWVGYPQCAVKYRRDPRVAGSTKYPLRKMLAFAWTAATSFSTLPLQIGIVLGLIAGLLGIEEALRAVVALLSGRTVPGWTSLMVLTSILGGAVLISIGIVGQYVGKIYEESKGRPLYLVARTFNVSSAEEPNPGGACDEAHGSSASAC